MLSDEEIQRIGDKLAEQVIKAISSHDPSGIRTSCAGAGISFKELKRDNPSVYPVNVTGLVPADAFIVPHSELAMHVGAAGRRLVCWSISPDGLVAHIIFEAKDGGCGVTTGRPTEVMSHELIKVTKDILHIPG